MPLSMDKNINMNMHPKLNMNQSELLLPVGNKEMALAAIHGGANAIFIGVPGFNARGRSYDFSIEELKEIIDTCHLYGVKVNLAFNVLVFENELELAFSVLQKILPLGPDSIIVQDLGLVQMIRKYAPEQKIHGSTQMSITNYESIELLADLNIQRFVLGRENSLDEIGIIRVNTAKELEVFVHGALCVSYSGQCFTSESLGGRSANRGQCAQSCRFGYELRVDGKPIDLGLKKYLLSPQDLCGIEEMPRLLEAGVNSFKVEGRLKTAEYVASAAQVYRTIIDNYTQSAGGVKSQLRADFFAEARKKMATTYSRGFYSGWLNGVNHQKLVEGTFSSNRGYEFARIIGLGEHCIQIEIYDRTELSAGDGLLWAYEHGGETIEQGGFVYSVETIEANIFQVGLASDLKLSSYSIGARVFLNHDKNQKRELALLTEDKSRKRREPIKIYVELALGKPLKVSFSDGCNKVEGFSSQNAVVAKTKGITDSQLGDELSALTGSPFRAAQIEISRADDSGIFVPNREVKELRQALTQQLINRRTETKGPSLLPADHMKDWLISMRNTDKLSEVLPQATHPECRLNILLRERAQVEDLVKAIQTGFLNKDEINCVILDFEFGRDYLSSIDLLKANVLRTGLATTRILKPTEYKNLKSLVALQPDVILVRNLGAFEYLKRQAVEAKIQLLGDFSLNVTNSLTAHYLFGKGLKSLCVSYDLNRNQVADLLRNTCSGNFEITVHQYMPSFHMEHCVFAAFLSQGKSWRDCGRPCEKHQVQLQDQFGNLHEIKPDQECRNTMYNTKSQSAARFIDEWKNLGLGFIRYEALKERENELITKIGAYADYLHGRIEFERLKNVLGGVESYGLSEGQLSKTREYQSRKKR
jgi:putative protease